MEEGNMKKAIINSLNGKLKDNVKANDIATEIINETQGKQKGVFHGKLKISEDNSERILEEILTINEIDEMPRKHAETMLNKIKFSKLYLEDGQLYYVTQKTIDMGNGPTNKFKLSSPEQAAFTDNDVNLLEIIQFSEMGNMGAMPKDLMPKTACIFLGIPCDFKNKLTTGDVVNIFQIGVQLFLAS